MQILTFQKIYLLLKLTFRATELRQRPKFNIFQKALFGFWRQVQIGYKKLFQLKQGSIYEEALLF